MRKKASRSHSPVESNRRAASRKPPPRPARPQKPVVPAGSMEDDALDLPGGGTDFPVVAVGASAGGLEAFSQVLEHLPASADLAIVLVQHLSPQHVSSLPELLAAKTPMTVVFAGNGMRIEPRHIYVMPPNVQIAVVDGLLHLLPRPTDRSQFTPIDVFMQSLARWAQDAAVAVVLSGLASDGAAGIREVKGLGGITIAQKPETTKHDGMPRAAIDTGMVDLILSPEEIGEYLGHVRLDRYLHRTVAGESVSPEFPISDHQLTELFAVLRRSSGIDFKQYKMPTVKRRLLRRMALLRLTDVADYLRHLDDTPAEAKKLSQDLLIHVTRFFRDPESFVAIASHVLPEFLRDRMDDHDPIRIWVPGCATGEEAYSIGICLLEVLGDRVTDRRIQIFATDVSEAAIDHARTGSYPVSIAADVSTERLRRYFSKSDGTYRVVKALRDMCVFARHDLTRDPPFSRLDFIACRNVLIYLDVALQKRLISIFHYALKSRGFLMLGSAETPGSQGYFTVVDKKWRIFRKTAVDFALPFALGSDLHAKAAAPTASARVKYAVDGKSVQDEATRLILDRYGPPGAVVDANLQIVQFRGHTGPYLEPAAGEPNLSILKMARGGLLHPLRTALQQARRGSKIVRKERVHVQRDGDWTEIALEVVPLVTARGEHYLILFAEAARGAAKGRKAGHARRPDTPTGESDVRLSDLRQELAANREYLQSIIQELEAANEELQSANEEILSSNEELQSTNEELDTAKEELQSMNEELNTLNEELHSRNDELTRVNSDLTNLLNSVEIPIVIVGSDLGIRRFTSRAEQLFNLIPGDVGRPVGQIKPNFSCDDLEGLIRETIDTITPREREVQDKSGRWLSIRVRPYKAIDNRLDGAVLSVIDVDAARRHQAYVEHSRDHFRAIVDAIGQPLLVLDARGLVRSANRWFYEMYSLTPKEAEGRDFIRLGDGRWDGSMLRNLIESVLRDGATAERTVDIERTGESRRTRFVAHRIPLDDAQPGVVLAIQDLGDGSQHA